MVSYVAGESQKGRLFIEIEPDPITGVGVISGPSDWHRGVRESKEGRQSSHMGSLEKTLLNPMLTD